MKVAVEPLIPGLFPEVVCFKACCLTLAFYPQTSAGAVRGGSSSRACRCHTDRRRTQNRPTTGSGGLPRLPPHVPAAFGPPGGGSSPMASPATDAGQSHQHHSASLSAADCASREAQTWIEAVTGRCFGDKDFRGGLENGILLCELLSSIKPGLVKKINRLPTPIAGLDNLSVFLRGCEELGLKGSQLFDPGDLQDTSTRPAAKGSDCSRRLKNVLITIYWLGRAANSCTSYNGPTLDLKEFEALLSQMRKEAEEAESPKRCIRDSGYVDCWDSERSDSLSPPRRGREDSFDSLDSLGSRSQQTPSPDVLVARGNSDGRGSDSESDGPPHRKLPDVHKDDMLARRTSVSEPRTVVPFNQYLPNRANQGAYLPTPLRKRRGDKEEGAGRKSWSTATSPVGGDRPSRSVSMIDMRGEEEALLQPHSQVRHELMHNQYNKMKEEENHWQDDLARWKSRRRSISQDLIKKEEERKMMERLMSGDGCLSHRRRSIKTYREIADGFLRVNGVADVPTKPESPGRESPPRFQASPSQTADSAPVAPPSAAGGSPDSTSTGQTERSPEPSEEEKTSTEHLPPLSRPTSLPGELQKPEETFGTTGHTEVAPQEEKPKPAARYSPPAEAKQKQEISEPSSEKPSSTVQSEVNAQHPLITSRGNVSVSVESPLRTASFGCVPLREKAADCEISVSSPQASSNPKSRSDFFAPPEDSEKDLCSHEKYRREQEKLKEEWEKAQREVVEEERKYHEEERRILEETVMPLTPRSSALSSPSRGEPTSLPEPQDTIVRSLADWERKQELLERQSRGGGSESTERKRRENDRTSDISTADDSMKTSRSLVSQGSSSKAENSLQNGQKLPPPPAPARKQHEPRVDGPRAANRPAGERRGKVSVSN
ncbi:unnamed protein product [Menidia menidia]|uniref:(Atlantic silverside) hypothetical protein n=1 Tax=Menidia menidia TaxID=238744 RepID=A0A8S4BGS5_9TELE|nr:unnamed protein product [Menidia menidia]